MFDQSQLGYARHSGHAHGDHHRAECFSVSLRASEFSLCCLAASFRSDAAWSWSDSDPPKKTRTARSSGLLPNHRVFSLLRWMRRRQQQWWFARKQRDSAGILHDYGNWNVGRVGALSNGHAKCAIAMLRLPPFAYKSNVEWCTLVLNVRFRSGHAGTSGVTVDPQRSRQ